MSEPDHTETQDIDTVAAAILDGTPVDWTRPLPAEPALLDELRVLAQIAAVHRSALGDAISTGLQTWGHLTIIEKLGRGTSGEVFLAIDNRLQRSVALKLLYAGAGPASSPTAAIDEACMLARVRHPNVVTVFGAEAIDGRVGIITEHIEGRTLADVLGDQGPLGAEEAATTGMVLCRALSAVHQAGLVHRDIKAQNVMREKGGRIVLMDIGAGHRVGVGATNLSGTPLYVAPEVLAGAPASARSDIYSLGTLLFHLVTGAFPVSGESLHAIQAAHRAGIRTRVGELRPNLPAAFTSAVERALDADPAKRFSSAAKFEGALAAAVDTSSPRIVPAPRRARRAGFALAAVVAVATGGAAWIAWAAGATPSASVAFQSREWVLVVPFENRTGNPSLDGALEHAFRHALSTSAYVNVVPPERVDDALRLMTLPVSTPLDARRAREVAARDGNVRVILAGSIGHVGGTYPITVNVIDPATGGVLASAREEPREESEIPDAIRTLSSWVRLTLGEASRQVAQGSEILEKATTPSLGALQDYSEAMKAARTRTWGLAETWLKAATAKDPEFASAHIWLAWAQSNLAQANANQTLGDEALRSAQRAVDLVGKTTPRERHFILGSSFYLQDQNAQAAAEFEALLTLYPDDYWGQYKLYEVSRRTMGADMLREMAVRGAAARPNDPESQLRAATEVLRADIAAARPYFARAVKLARASDALGANDLIYASSFESHDLWTQRRIADAERALNEAERKHPAARGDDWAHLRGVTFRLTLGQPYAAGQFVTRMEGADMRAMAQALVALAREDMASIPRLLADYRFYDVVAVSALVRAGRVVEAERMLGRLVTEPEPFAVSAAEIAVVRGDLGEPRQTLQSAISRMGFAGARSYLYTETLAEALVKAGDVPGAIKALEDQVAGGDAALSRAGHPGYLWMRCAKKLADVYRTEGRIDDARRIERDLLAALSRAEPDFPLLLELRRRAGR